MHFVTLTSVAAILVGVATPATATFGFGFGSSGNCGYGQWYWGDKKLCIPIGGVWPDVPPPPGNACPILWFWDTEAKICAPRYVPPFSQPMCNNGWVWNTSTYTCQQPAQPPPPDKNCGPSLWWWANRSSCLPHGFPNPPPPPYGTACPLSWYWHSPHSCCVPHHPPPTPGPPSCSPGWSWSPYTQSCKRDENPPPAPRPSNYPRGTHDNTKRRIAGGVPHQKKRAPKSEEHSMCPAGLTACSIAGLSKDEYECVDTLADLKSCGGCLSVGTGQDCTAIPHVGVSSCTGGSCVVLSCEQGYTISKDKKSCITYEL
ncbi:Pria protein [Ceratobasidium theobromae]|uniref:Pria protein n=1 Tax=Ceratobasidium theobromae TaxID=1582974 RepID=A0A5N5QVR2_9AGAM|nr:Pria protein [Ceratobasidium theobromae]